MSHEKLYEEATKVAAKPDEVVLEGRDGVDVKGTPKAAERTAGNLFEGAMTAGGQGLAKENAELSFAFYGFVSLISSYIISGSSFNAETLADEYEQLAKEAGEQLAIVSGEPPRPNPHLQFLADMMRKVGKPAALTEIEGGEADPGPA